MKSTSKAGFSLVEVTMAVGIVSFSLLGLVALLPAGLQNVQESVNDSGVANVVSQVRAELNQLEFSDLGSAIDGAEWMFRESGQRTSPSKEPFFAVKLSTADPEGPGLAQGFGDSVQAVRVTISYPVAAPESARESREATLLVSR